MVPAPSPQLTRDLTRFISAFDPARLPPRVLARTRVVVRDGLAALLAAAQPAVTTGPRIAHFVRQRQGRPEATVVGHGFRTGAADAALANGTMGYACDVEPHHPKAVIHPLAVMVPASLAVGERFDCSGLAFLGAVALGCEVAYRLSVALDPVGQCEPGFHPSAVCGAFGAAAAAGHLLDLDAAAKKRALGLAACQASGLMAWQSDPTENSRPFQLGVAARNGVTAALLAEREFGGPAAVLDSPHGPFRAFTTRPHPEWLESIAADAWEGITGLAVKPYACVAEMHPALDALLPVVRERNLAPDDVARLVMRFARSCIHCVQENPLRSHSGPYLLAVAVAAGDVRVADLFRDRRRDDPAVAALSRRIEVIADDGELEDLFPETYATIMELTLRGGETITLRNDTARGYANAPLAEVALVAKVQGLLSGAVPENRIESLIEAADGLAVAKSLANLTEVLGPPVAP